METKPGLKTTEFWITAIPVVLAFVGVILGKVPFDQFMMLAGGGGGLYTLSRGIAKNGIKPD